MFKNGFELSLPVKWNISQNTPNGYATNFIVQRTATEFVVYFFEILPPLLLGTQEEIDALLKDIEFVEANCIARITIAPSRMVEFANLLNQQLENNGDNQEDVE